MEEYSPLFSLNNDCLKHLFEFLDLDDVIELYLIAPQHFRETAQDWMQRWMAKYEFMELGDRMDASEFLRVFGYCIKRLMLQSISSRRNRDYFSLLSEYCTSLETLKLDIDKSVENVDMTFLGRMKQIRSLVVEGIFEDSLTKEIIKLDNLESLHIESIDYTGAGLCELRNLKELDLQYCEKVTNENFLSAYRANRNLTKINITGCVLIGRDAYEMMVKEQRPLKSLKFDSCTLLHNKFIPGLHHLESLTLGGECYSAYCDRILAGYAATIGQTLTSLTINDWTEFDFPASLHFPNLTELNLSISEMLDPDGVLVKLPRIVPRLERVRFTSSWYLNVRYSALCNFFCQSENLVYADIQLPQCYSADLYGLLVAERMNHNMQKTLKVVLHERSRFYGEMLTYMKGEEYTTQRKFIEIEDRPSDSYPVDEY